MKHHRLAIQAVAAVIEAAGLCWRAGHGGKHPCVVVTAPDGSQHRIVLCSSPRTDEQDQANYGRQRATQLLERLGLKAVTSGRDRHRRRRGAQPPKALVLIFDRPDHSKGPYRDPWAALREFSK